MVKQNDNCIPEDLDTAAKFLNDIIPLGLFEMMVTSSYEDWNSGKYFDKSASYIKERWLMDGSPLLSYFTENEFPILDLNDMVSEILDFWWGSFPRDNELQNTIFPANYRYFLNVEDGLFFFGEINRDNSNKVALKFSSEEISKCELLKGMIEQGSFKEISKEEHDRILEELEIEFEKKRRGRLSTALGSLAREEV
jgi:hypothetical protein